MADPVISQATYDPLLPKTRALGDRALKADGYGVVTVSKGEGQFVIHCWPHDRRPGRGEEYPGWPLTLPSSDV